MSYMINIKCIYATLLCILLIPNIQSAEPILASIYYNKVTGKYTITKGIYDTNAIAYAKYTPNFEEIGWDYLTLSSYTGPDTSKYRDLDKAYAMGYLEGYITSHRIYTFYSNVKSYRYRDYGGVMPNSIRQFLIDNNSFLKEQINLHKDSDPFWEHIAYTTYQFQGIVDGYNANTCESDKKISYLEYHVINCFGDITELANYDKSLRADFSKMTAKEIGTWFDDHNHCCTFIKTAADFSDIFFSHNTWLAYNHMHRIFKEYRFSTKNKHEKVKTYAFSSYPGVISSPDDFYITDQDLYIAETTHQIWNTSLYDNMSSQTVLTWLRAVVSMKLSANAEDFLTHFTKYNSGTYNNQFQILDMKLVDLDKKFIHDNAFMIIEQIPGHFQHAYKTNILKRGYWASYNTPSFDLMQEIGGVNQYLEEYPELIPKFDYERSSRGEIFRRDQHSINSIEDMQHIITYNNFQYDPLSYGDASCAVAGRRDLLSEPLCSGMIDAKVASVSQTKGIKGKRIRIISGPTYAQQDAFNWKNTTCYMGHQEFKHDGQPDEWKFPWVEYTTELFE